jgi:hypothetical protein
LQNTNRTNFKTWFDAKNVVSKKRGEIAQIIREKFPGKNFPLLFETTVTAAQNPQLLWPDSSRTNQQVSHFKTIRKYTITLCGDYDS